MGPELQGVDLVTKFRAGRVACAEGVLSQILRNLIGNAIKFRAHSRPLRITIETRDVGPMVEIAIEDNGARDGSRERQTRVRALLPRPDRPRASWSRPWPGHRRPHYPSAGRNLRTIVGPGSQHAHRGPTAQGLNHLLSDLWRAPQWTKAREPGTMIRHLGYRRCFHVTRSATMPVPMPHAILSVFAWLRRPDQVERRDRDLGSRDVVNRPDDKNHRDCAGNHV